MNRSRNPICRRVKQLIVYDVIKGIPTLMMPSKYPKREKVCIINCACVLSYVGLNFALTEYSGWKMSKIAFRFEAKIRLILSITRKGKFLS